MDCVTFHSELNIDEFLKLIRDLSNGNFFNDGGNFKYHEEKYRERPKKCTSFGISIFITTFDPDNDNDDTISVYYKFNGKIVIIEIQFNLGSPRLIKTRFDVFHEFSRFIPPKNPEFTGIQTVSVEPEIKSLDPKLLCDLRCKCLDIDINDETLNQIEKMERVEVLEITDFEQLCDVIHYPRKLPVESIEITTNIDEDVIPLFEKIDSSFPNGHLLIQNYQQHCQKPNRFTRWLYPKKDFDTLIIAGLGNADKTQNWTKFLCRDTKEMGPYDPRLLVLIWAFSEDK